MKYVTRYVWNDNGLCDVMYLWKRRHCNVCGSHRRFLVNVGKKKWECLTCGIGKKNEAR